MKRPSSLFWYTSASRRELSVDSVRTIAVTSSLRLAVVVYRYWLDGERTASAPL